jgi:hypothetical protein
LSIPNPTKTARQLDPQANALTANVLPNAMGYARSRSSKKIKASSKAIVP